MSLSRREFLMSLAASGAILTQPRMSFGGTNVLYPARDLSYFAMPIHHGAFDLRIGYASIDWKGNDTQAIEDISSLGYPGIQLRANIISEFPDPHALRDLLALHHLKFVALSSGTIPLDPAVRQQTIDTHLKNAHYLREAGGSYLQLIGDFPKGRALSAQDFRYEGQLLTEIAKRVADDGLETGFHNHMGSTGQTPEAVDAILAAADPKYVKLELDTAHYVQGGGDPAACIRKYGRRLLYLHLKDVRNAPIKQGYEFAELGQGRVDFPAVFQALRAVHFRGWGIVELDGPRPDVNRTPKESAAMSKNYLERKMGVRV